MSTRQVRSPRHTAGAGCHHARGRPMRNAAALSMARPAALRRRTVELSFLSLLVPAAAAGYARAEPRVEAAALGTKSSAAADHPSLDTSGGMKHGGRTDGSELPDEMLASSPSEAGPDADADSESDSDSDSSSSSSSDEESMRDYKPAARRRKKADMAQQAAGGKEGMGGEGQQPSPPADPGAEAQQQVRAQMEEDAKHAKQQRKEQERLAKQQRKEEKRLAKEKETSKMAAEQQGQREVQQGAVAGATAAQGEQGQPWPAAAGGLAGEAAGDAPLGWLLGQLLQ